MKKKIIPISAIVLIVLSSLFVIGCGEAERGPQGVQGSAGIDGSDGNAGSKGDRGFTGSTGPQGETGDRGYTGATGIKGSTGAIGAIGETGPAGRDGWNGGSGPRGQAGPPGPQGPVGVAPAPLYTVSLNPRGASTISMDPVMSGNSIWSVHLNTNGTAPTGDTAEIILTPINPMTLNQVTSIEWLEYLVAGYPPHVDILFDLDLNGFVDEGLVFEYAYNGHTGDSQPTYGAITGGWYQTFSDDGNGPVSVTDSAYAWLASGPPGGPGIIGGSLAAWKAGTVDPSVTGSTPIFSIHIEIDNWLVVSDAYLDYIKINGITVWE